MNLTELSRRLEAAGASPANYSLGRRDYNGFCLMQLDGRWAVFFSERGLDQAPIFTSPDEAAACQFYFDFTMQQRHLHSVALLRSKPAADAVQARLTAAGIASTRHELYYAAPADYRQQVVVEGPAIFAARRLLGDQLPLEDAAGAGLSWWQQLRRWVRQVMPSD